MKNFVRSVVVVGSLLSLSACGSEAGEEPEVATAEQAAKPAACTGFCIEGYVFNPKTCQCQAACTTTALCVSGYQWDELACRCARTR